MKRVLTSACLLFGLAGCDSGDAPTDTKTTDKPISSIKTDMKDGPKMPDGGAPVKDAPKAPAAAPDAGKN
jgi:hypothetical protein